MGCIKRSVGFGILLEKPGIELPPFWLVDDPLYTYTDSSFWLNFSSEFEPACLSLDWLIVPEHVCTASCVYLLVKMLVWVCFPARTWISGVGYSRHQQSRIKSIFILARQQSVLLLGDAATRREEGEKKEQAILLLLPPSSFLSRSVTPSSSLAASSCSSSLHLSTAFLFFSFLLSRLKSPRSLPPDSSCYLFLSSFSPGRRTTAYSCWHRGMADGPLWSSRQFWDFSGFREVH